MFIDRYSLCLTKVQLSGPHGPTFQHQLSEAIAVQRTRMEKATSEERARKEASKKRSLSLGGESSDAKRQKLEQDAAATSAAFLAGFDFTSLPAALITELVVANLQAFTEPALISLVQAYQEKHATNQAPQASTSAQSAPEPGPSSSVFPPPVPAVKAEPVDPLKMDIDEEEIEYEPDKLNMEVRGNRSNFLGSLLTCVPAFRRRTYCRERYRRSRRP